jgi:hypothetical protein
VPGSHHVDAFFWGGDKYLRANPTQLLRLTHHIGTFDATAWAECMHAHVLHTEGDVVEEGHTPPQSV